MVERALSMREAPGSIPGISMIYFCHLLNLDILNIEHGRFLLVGDVAQW